MTKTALTKAIEQIKQNRVIEIRPYIYLEAMNDVVKLLADLLPYEREVIEGAFSDGCFNMLHDNPYNNKSDYFTKTFTNNAND